MDSVAKVKGNKSKLDKLFIGSSFIEFIMSKENQNIEWKESWRDEYLGWISGFANAHGGKIFIGLDDKENIVGLQNPERYMEDIPNKIQTNLGIICDVNLHEKAGKFYIEVDVKPQTVGISYKGEYHYRSGATKQVLRGQALSEFLLKKTGRTWDDVIEPRATYKDLDLAAIETFKTGALRSGRIPSIGNYEDNMYIFDNLRLLEDEKLKRAAVILFGTDRGRYFMNAFIKIGRFGSSETDLKFQEVVEGPAYQLADATLDLLKKKFLVYQISYKGLQRIETGDYPNEALREIILNAIVHRDYTGAPIQIKVFDDRLVFWNEGKLPDDLKIEDLKKEHPSRPRNQLIANVFFKGGLIESWGRGTLKIIEECKVHGLLEPEIEEVFGGISVTLYKSIYNEKHLSTLNLNSRQFEALLTFKEKGEIKTNDYILKFKVVDRTALRDLTELVKKGLLVKSGEKKGSKYLFK